MDPASSIIHNHTGLKTVFTVIIIFWSIAIGVTAWNHIEDHRKTAVNTALEAARTTYRKDQAIRRWAASHGGVYAPVTEETPPNPRLSDVPERDIRTPSGRALTLMNPNYALSQIQEKHYALYGIKGRLIGFTPFKKDNTPDLWELTALNLLRSQPETEEVYSLEKLNGKEYLRFLGPMTAEPDCLKCHEIQGYKTGDLMGGISIAVPWVAYRKQIHTDILQTLTSYSIAAAAGLILFFISWKLLHKSIGKLMLTEKNLTEEKQKLKELNQNLEIRIKEELEKRRHSEMALLHQSRISSMAEMANAIAHHWRQPLSIISLNLETLIADYEEKNLTVSSRKHIADITTREIREMSSILDQLCQFTLQKEEKSLCCALDEIHSVVLLLRPRLEPDHIKIQGICFGSETQEIALCQCDPETEKLVRIYPAEFKQTIFNIILNARDAILEKRRSPGKLSEEGIIRISFSVNETSEDIIIEDNGCGFTPEPIERIFEPFFTTKERGRGSGAITGTGLGLYFAKMIIEERMGGTITAENTGDGARIRIRLPLAPAAK